MRDASLREVPGIELPIIQAPMAGAQGSALAVAFRHFTQADTGVCLALFELNCPASFAPEERADYAAFLRGADATYEVCLSGGRVVGAFGLTPGEAGSARVNWILLDPAAKGTGVGAAMMQRAIGLARGAGATHINIAASHLSEAFFAKFGARTLTRQEGGWGPGMHRHDMVLEV
jgi:GNAT superfamily N-acetyltransferase